MKKVYIFSGMFLLIGFVSFLCFYSYDKFKTYNFIKAFYGVNELSQENLTYGLGNNIILVNYEFKDDYINYLISLYEEQGWDLVLNDSSSYSFCYNGDCDDYKFYLDEFFSKSYGLLIMI